MNAKIGTILPPEKPNTVPKYAKWLSGQGVGTWFCIDETPTNNQFIIKRFTPEGKLDCDRIFEIGESDSIFNINESYEFIHVSHCAKCRIIQNNVVFVFEHVMAKSE